MLWVVVGVDFVTFGLVFPILPLYARHLGLSVAAVGALIACYSLTQLLAAPAWGRASDRFGRRPVILAATAGSACSCLLLALAGGPGLLFVAVALNGVSGGSAPVAQAAVSDVVAPGQEARAFGRIGATIASGFVLGPALAALSALGGVRVPFILAAVLAGANFLLAVARFPETRPPARRTDDRLAHPHRRAATSASRRELLVAFGLTTAAFGAFEATFSLVARRHFGFGPSGTGVAFAVVGLTMAAVQGAGVAPLVRRLAPRVVLGVAAVCLAGGLVVLGSAHGFGLLAIGLLLLAAGEGLGSSFLTAAIAQSAPAGERGAILGRQQAIAGIARIVGPLAGGLLLAGAGSSMAYDLAAGGVCAALVLASTTSGGMLLDRLGGRAPGMPPAPLAGSDSLASPTR